MERIGGSALLVSDFLAIPESEGIYFAGPALDFGSNVNEATGRSGDQLNAAYRELYNGPPSSRLPGPRLRRRHHSPARYRGGRGRQ